MAGILIHQEKAREPEKLQELCPFDAIEFTNGILSINSGCRMCRICIKKGPEGVFEFVEDKEPQSVNKDEWQGITVFVEHNLGKVHPVTFELIGKAFELAGKTNQKVYCLLAGHKTENLVEELLEYGPDEIYIYDFPELKHFRIEPYTAVFEDFIKKVKPSTILVGGTAAGRSLAPRTAARFRTGLTADCTMLDIRPNTDLDQIRPAYGGNIMAHINTPKHRPQFATVRYKIFSAPEKNASGKNTKTVNCKMDPAKLVSAIKVLELNQKSQEIGIEDAEVIVVAGRGLKKAEDLALINELAELLDAKIAATRSLIEAGWVDPKRQIGLSGRTVKPKLIITCGVSGAIQFVAGMNNSELIIAINTDENASIFKVAHIGIVGDLYQVVPSLIDKIKEFKKVKP
ncbi:MAG: electron transfer flavoprotein subunit alpha [Lentisphaerae bacterium GWF2_45_14]|nr:MAG: electron transfer flavoprotein subunit alpha [Lentisphaerae bacterium GWF2_45_14]